MIRNMVRTLLTYDAASNFVEATGGRIINYLRVQRAEALRQAIEHKWLPLTVKTTPDVSPFAGMKYEGTLAVGSAAYPKHTGTYENELLEDLRCILRRKYDLVVDIGSAEGWYAVGIAKVMSDVPVIAYDISAVARRNCRRLAELNNVLDRITLREFCDSRELADLCEGSRCLVVSDCEGFEKFLFTEESVKACAFSTVVIEVHDFSFSGIGEHLDRIFKKTHVVKKVNALSKSQKIKDFSSDTRREVPTSILEFIVDEHRPPGMYWLIAEPKPSTKSSR